LSVLTVACLLGTQSRAGLIALITEFVAMAWLIRTSLAKIVAGLVTLSLISTVVLAVTLKSPVTPNAGPQVESSIPVKTGVATIVHRLDIWRFTLDEIAKHWLVGIGYGGETYSLSYGKEDETVEPGHLGVKDKGTHNILLYLALHVGLAGMALFTWFYVSAIRTTIQEFRKTVDWMSRMVLAGTTGSLIGLFFRLQFYQMLVGSLAILFWALLAMGILHYPSLKERTREPVSA
jgi:O-antigen ligase